MKRLRDNFSEFSFLFICISRIFFYMGKSGIEHKLLKLIFCIVAKFVFYSENYKLSLFFKTYQQLLDLTITHTLKK